MFNVFIASLLCQITACHICNNRVYDTDSATIQKSRFSVDVLIDGCGRLDYTDYLPDGIDLPLTEVFFHLVNNDISYRLPVVNNIENSFYFTRSSTPFTIWVTTCYDGNMQQEMPHSISYIDSIAISKKAHINDHTDIAGDIDGIIMTLDNTLDDGYSLDLEIIDDNMLYIILNKYDQGFRVFRWTVENDDIEFNDVSLQKDKILYLRDEMRLLNWSAIYTYFPKAFAYRRNSGDELIWIDMKSYNTR